MKKIIFIAILVTSSDCTFSQITIGTGTTLVTGSNTILSTNVNSYLNKGGTRVVISNLIINGGGDKPVSGEWEVSNALNLLNGIIVPDGTAKFVYAGSNENLTYGIGGFFNGYFYTRGTGLRDFPIGYKDGNRTTLAPARLIDLPDASGEVGIRVIQGDPQFIATPELENILTTHYWEVSTTVNSTVALSLNGLNAPAGGLVVLQSPGIQQAAINLSSSSFSDSFVTSYGNVTMPVLAVGVAKEFEVKVHDLITPYNSDTYNPSLFIENIELTAENKVTLMDRWGVVQKEWKGYDNNDPKFDFSKLGPGNYICVVEYKIPGSVKTSKVSQMVTVLKTN